MMNLILREDCGEKPIIQSKKENYQAFVVEEWCRHHIGVYNLEKHLIDFEKNIYIIQTIIRT